MLAVFAGLSPLSRARRFLTGMTRLPALMLAALTDVDGCDHVAWVASVDGRPVGIGRYARADDTRPRSRSRSVPRAPGPWSGLGAGRHDRDPGLLQRVHPPHRERGSRQLTLAARAAGAGSEPAPVRRPARGHRRLAAARAAAGPARRGPRPGRVGRPSGSVERCPAPDPSSRRGPAGPLQVRQHGQHAPVLVLGWNRPSLIIMLRTWLSTVRSVSHRRLAIPVLVGPRPSGPAPRARAGELVQRVVAAGVDQPRDDLRVERGAAPRRHAAAASRNSSTSSTRSLSR